jgi:hypothetical protein
MTSVPLSALSGRAAGSVQCPRCRRSRCPGRASQRRFELSAVSPAQLMGRGGFACQLCARPVDYNCKQRPERDVIGELRHERQGVDCWEPAADQADVDDPDREPGCCTPGDRPASGQRSGQHFPARSGDADMDDGAAREPTPPWRVCRRRRWRTARRHRPLGPCHRPVERVASTAPRSASRPQRSLP